MKIIKTISTQRVSNIMYQGYPDFQNMITTATQRFIGSYLQSDAYYLYPESLGIQAADPLPFSLDIVRSSSADSIYGWLNFTTELQYGIRSSTITSCSNC